MCTLQNFLFVNYIGKKSKLTARCDFFGGLIDKFELKEKHI